MITQYIRVQRSMLRCGHLAGLSLDGIWLYHRLLDRCTLSARNGLADIQGRVYIFCSRESAASLIGCSVRKAGMLLQQLLSCGLLRAEQYGNNRRLYVRQWCEPSPFHPLAELMPNGWWDVTLERVDVMPDDYMTMNIDIANSDLSTRAKLLYAMLMDENGKQELYGRDVCSIPREEAMELLNCTHNTLDATYTELEAAGLIFRSPRQGYGKPRAVSVQSPKNCTTVTHFLTTSRPIPTPPVAQFLHTNQPIYPSVSNHPFSASLCTPASAGEQEAPRMKEIIFDVVEATHDAEKLCSDTATAQEAVAAVEATITADISSHAQTYCIGSVRRVSKTELLKRYQNVDRWTMATIISKLVDNWNRIKNRTRYIRAALYNADKHQGEAYYTKLRLTAA